MRSQYALAISIAMHFALLGVFYDWHSQLIKSRNLSKAYSVTVDYLPEVTEALVPVVQSDVVAKAPTYDKPIVNKTSSKLQEKVRSDLNASSGRSSQAELTLKDLYFQKVRSIIEQKQFYPTMARRMKHQGVVNVFFTIDRAGKVISIEQINSEHKTLAMAVQTLLQDRVQFPVVPEVIEGESIPIELPIRFQLK